MGGGQSGGAVDRLQWIAAPQKDGRVLTKNMRTGATALLVKCSFKKAELKPMHEALMNLRLRWPTHVPGVYGWDQDRSTAFCAGLDRL